jgi:hypothetical protein
MNSNHLMTMFIATRHVSLHPTLNTVSDAFHYTPRWLNLCFCAMLLCTRIES